ncbi:hypothetical protein IWW38_000547 [Coemansia aciculifera]|uniref:Uncharacterized protein n=1 Tax=Coemansia aciculifera TaxID=417176 RepID=A0ACC1M9L8_9FUNG|nr:hypothetical protein IWW38_000547 [Coemansia aciculifera]
MASIGNCRPLFRRQTTTTARLLTSTSVFHARRLHTDEGSSNATDSSTVSRNLSKLFQGTPAPADARFEVIDSSHGSLVRARLPPYSQLYAQVGQTLGQSPHARTRTTTKGAAAVAALRPLLGRHAFIQEISTPAATGAEILLAPRHAGDVVVLGMDGSRDYFVRRGCLLAQTKFLTVSTWNGIGAAFNALAFDKVSGRGSAVINTFGGLHRLVLGEGEEYLVDPRYVVAWSSTLDVAPQSGRPKPLQPHAAVNPSAPTEQQPSATPHHPSTASHQHAATAAPTPFIASSSPALANRVSQPAKSPAESTQKATAATSGGRPEKQSTSVASKLYALAIVPVWRVLKNSARAVAYGSANAVRVGGWAAAKTTRTLAGVPDLYRVTGPGDIYVSTRLAPKPWTRLTNTIAAKSSATTE